MLLKSPFSLCYAYLQKYFFNEKYCVACKTLFTFCTQTEHHILCPRCQDLIPLKPLNVCILCGHIFEQLNYTGQCLQCIKKPPPWDGLYYYSLYAKLLKILILRYKFSKDFSLIPLLSTYLAQTIKTIPTCDMLIPMPRHPKRLGSEGYNHVVELCRSLEKLCQIPLTLHSLQRTRYTFPQAGLTAKQRMRNPKKSFAAHGVSEKNIVLVDDIMTTGATLHHASLALRQAGAYKIYIALIARVEK